MIPEKGKTVSLQQVQKASGSTGDQSATFVCTVVPNEAVGQYTKFYVLTVGKIHTSVCWVLRWVGTNIWKVSTTYTFHPEDGVRFSETSMITY